MRIRARALRASLALALTSLTLAATAAPPSLNAELSRCAALTATDERLACYDALACATISAPAERLHCYDTLAKGKSAPAPEVVPGAERAGSAAAEGSFGGVVRHKEPPKPQGPDQIKAQVTKLDVDRRGNVWVTLDNGQAWTFNDPDALLKLGDAVTIHRAALGSYLMTTPTRHSYRVQRTQ